MYMLIYITGPTGSGKTTVGEKLQELGYEVYDTDKDGIRHWLDASGEPVRPFRQSESHSEQWLNKHVLGLPKSWLRELKQRSRDSTIFVCGTSPIDHVESGIWDKVIVLVIDEQTLISRVKKRTNSRYGKDPKQLEKAIKWRQPTTDRYKEAGAYEIDGTLTLKEIIDRVIKSIS